MVTTGTLKLSYNKDCFIHLPQQFKLNSNENAVQVEGENGGFVVGSVRHTSDHLVCINAFWALKNNLQNGQKVVIKGLRVKSVCKRVHVTTLSPEDYQIITTHSGFLERVILQQVAVVARGCVLPLWLLPSLCVLVRIELLDPDVELAVVGEGSEVVVEGVSGLNGSLRGMSRSDSDGGEVGVKEDGEQNYQQDYTAKSYLKKQKETRVKSSSVDQFPNHADDDEGGDDENGEDNDDDELAQYDDDDDISLKELQDHFKSCSLTLFHASLFRVFLPDTIPSKNHPSISKPSIIHPSIIDPSITHLSINYPTYTHRSFTHPSNTHQSNTHSSNTHSSINNLSINHPSYTHPPLSQCNGTTTTINKISLNTAYISTTKFSKLLLHYGCNNKRKRFLYALIKVIKVKEDDDVVKGKDGIMRGRDDDGRVRGKDDDGKVRGRDDDGKVRGRDNDEKVRGRDDNGKVRGGDDDGWAKESSLGRQGSGVVKEKDKKMENRVVGEQVNGVFSSLKKYLVSQKVEEVEEEDGGEEGLVVRLMGDDSIGGNVILFPHSLSNSHAIRDTHLIRILPILNKLKVERDVVLKASSISDVPEWCGKEMQIAALKKEMMKNMKMSDDGGGGGGRRGGRGEEKKSVRKLLLLNRRNVLDVRLSKDVEVKYKVTFSRSDKQATSVLLLGNKDLKKIEIKIGDRCGVKNMEKEVGDVGEGDMLEVMKEANESVESFINFQLKNKRYRRMNKVVVTAGRGMGKTTFLRCLEGRLKSFSIWVQRLELNETSSKRSVSLLKHLSDIIADAKRRSPSVILLDDIDIYISAITSTPSSTATHLTSLLNSTTSPTFIIATAECLNSLEHFEGYKHISLASSSSKTKQQFLKDKLQKYANVDGCVDKTLNVCHTEAYSPFDLQALLKLSIHQVGMRMCRNVPVTNASMTEVGTPMAAGNVDNENNFSICSDVCVKDGDVKEAIKIYQPLNLRNLSPPSLTNFSQIGGLQEVKRALTQTFLWPCRFPSLFKGMTVQRGVLLYGAPGTGKTLLASALAAELGVGVISVKGPELLSKYIGESEKAVRGVFEKAKKAMPCVLFFDELDSLAPRRGHDSTGVTDRVVNQLLAEMDGVEGGGVFVMAASNRPELIDPALLRPGRMNKLLHCPLPSCADREEILACLLTNSACLDESVVLSEIAQATENFTGADLKALTYDALLISAHSTILPRDHDTTILTNRDKDTGERDNSVDNNHHTNNTIISYNDKLTLRQQHLTAAINNIKPSIGAQQRRKYQEVHASISNNSFLQATNLKVTHA